MVQIEQNIPQPNVAKLTMQNDSVESNPYFHVAAEGIYAVLPKDYSATEGIQIDLADSLVYMEPQVAEPPAISLFIGHELQPTHTKMVEKPEQFPNWFTIILLGCIIIIAYLRASYQKRFFELLKATVDLRFASEMVREEKVLSQRISIFLTLVFFITSASFVYFLLQYFNISLFSGNGFTMFLKIGVSIFLLMLLRIILSETVGFIFKAQNEFSFYSFHIVLFNKALGLFLIPVLLGIIYVSALPKSVFIYTGMLLFLISYVLRLIRGLNIGFAKQGFKKFYLFFYFCTLEFLPVLVLAKIILQHTAG